MQGWIKLYRNISEHWIWEDPHYFKAWIAILLTVNYEDKNVLIEKELVECKRGQSLLSLKSWGKLFGNDWTIQRVRTFFKLLERDGMINIEGLRKTTRLTVCKYDEYQNLQHTDNMETYQQKTSRKHTNNIQRTSIKESKETEKWEEGKEQKKGELETLFEIFRNNYPGSKRGFDVEFENFKKGNKNWKEIVPILSDRLTYQLNARAAAEANGVFVPPWKNLKTWINQKCWTEEVNTINTGNIGNNGTNKRHNGATTAELAELFARKYATDYPQGR